MTSPAPSDNPATPLALDIWEGRTAAELAEAWQVPRVVLLAEAGSTNDVARALAAEGAQAGTTVLAERQLAGRGRSGRAWASPTGLGLYLSLVARLDGSVLPIYPLLTGLAVARALDPWTAGETRIKWPNDLLLHGRKVGGILCEASWSGPVVDSVVVGIGLNILHKQGDFPPELRETATALHSEADFVSRLDVATAVVRGVVDLLAARGQTTLDAEALADLNRRHSFAGKVVDVLEPESGRLRFSGRVERINTDGSVTIMVDGSPVAIHSGSLRLPATKRT